ncbi:SgcJ/EcaC family oxidoreductase [Roseobacter sp. HKCCD9010]|uniref:SgcJ/EcaC family oxidoreductase n=1 Tax=unclassified Roseobacter TaxID=196798 RepID=UPI001491F8EC|nr:MULTISPECIES: SgcJ/EcaC family oxidoreductase [unclassified Roseobacter]MBF9049537.1 SgcJ/EcaC family oxidoreductase [Rhodobacterales bacterium HKCCD4356]NNV11537.1 SgcJ/EcaC family oxidoreductase [Roseobacter sp. HKCCD7357]NNV15721.1 SgcJ/EcaC family oxidoreductase [Roseobacter sp. HKCCD8768]NNV25181.1 SgcJ/EcaC family oxidoreductase [Roseobacter sp. HKCCD8192]NNV29438.1 SgcJ/EcaC family oxidoreductase [Roseobacter sp. HKCCD9061]
MPALPQTPEDIPNAFAAAWMARDAKVLAAFFAEDADFVNVVGIWWEDRMAIEKAHDYGLRTFFSKSRLAIGRVKTRRVTADVAIVHARMRLTGQRAPDGSEAAGRSTILSFAAHHTDRGWQVVSAQNTDIVPGVETQLNTGGHLTPADYRNP